MAIYYSILYPPMVPISYPAFELKKPEDTFRVYFEPSVGNKISEFKGGFIRIRNAETEKNALLPVGDGYLDSFLPFRNPFAEHIDLIDAKKNVLQPEGYNKTIPKVEQNERGEYYIDLRHEVFTMSGSQTDIRYKLQIMITRDWVSSTGDYGRGNILVYNNDNVNPGYERIDTTQYFGGNLVQKGLSEWSTNALMAPVSEANYELHLDGDNIYSPIFEFVGSTVDDNIRNNTMANYLKAYRINIYKMEEEEKGAFVDSSDWIIGQEASNLEIRWQNVVELENKTNYIIELDIQTAWELRKTFTYRVYTQFEASLFRGDVKVLNDHDYARSKIILNVETPLQWGPKDNFDIATEDRDYADIDGEASIIEGIDFFSEKGSLAGEMIVSGIDPIKNWHENDKRWFFKLKGPEISDKNFYQESYTMYAHSIPLGKDKTTEGPYEDDIIINPVIESPTGEIYKTYVDSSRTPEPYFDKDKISKSDTTHKIISSSDDINMTSEIYVKNLPIKNELTKSGDFSVSGFYPGTSWSQKILPNGNLGIKVPTASAQHFRFKFNSFTSKKFKKGDIVTIQYRAKASESIKMPLGLSLEYTSIPFGITIPLTTKMETITKSYTMVSDGEANFLYMTSTSFPTQPGVEIEIESVVCTINNSVDGKYYPTPEDYGIVHGHPNLLAGTSNEWVEYKFSSYDASSIRLQPLEATGLKVGDKVTFSAEIKNTEGEDDLLCKLLFYDAKSMILRILGSRIPPGSTGVSLVEATIPDGTTRIGYYQLSKWTDTLDATGSVRGYKLIKGTKDMMDEWTPHQSESGLTIINDGYVPYKNASFLTMNLRNNTKGRFKFFVPDEYNKISNIVFESATSGQIKTTNNSKESTPSIYQRIDVRKTDMKDNYATIYFEGVNNEVVNFDYARLGYDLTLDASEVTPLLSDLGGVVTMPSKLPSSHTYFYLEDEEKNLWRTTITPKGEFVTDLSHKEDINEFLKPIYFWDAHTSLLVKPFVNTKGVIDLEIVAENYNLNENLRPPYVNEFRFVKEVYAKELGRKVQIMKQTYKAYMTDFNKKLGKWHKIEKNRKYYIYFNTSQGQIKLVVRDLSANDLENGFDRFTLTYADGANMSVSSDMFAVTTGVNNEFLEPQKEDGSPLPYVVTIGESGILTDDLGFISPSTSTSNDFRESDIEEMRNKGEIEE